MDKDLISNIAIRLPCKCNLDCRYCCGKIKPKTKPLTFSEIKNIVVQSKALGAKIVYIVGEGEPFLYPKIKELISFIDDLGLIPTIYSNCILIDLKLAKFLFKKSQGINK